MFGEPIEVLVEIRNASTAPLSVPDVGSQSSSRNLAYVLAAVDEEGRPVPDALVEVTRPERAMAVTSLPPGVHRETLLLNQWCRFERPGTYRVTARHQPGSVPTDGAGGGTPVASVHWSAEDSFEIVLRRDDARAREVHDRMLADLDFITLSWLWHPSLESRFIEWLGGPLWTQEASALLRALERAGRPAHVRGIAALIVRGERDQEVLQTAVREVLEHDVTEAIPWMRRVLERGPPRAKAIVAGSLSGLGWKAQLTTEELAPLLKSEDVELRYQTVLALGYSGGNGRIARRLLQDSASRDPEDRVRFSSAAMLAVNRAPEEGVRALILRLQESEGLGIYFLQRSTGFYRLSTAQAWTEWARKTGGRESGEEKLRRYLALLESQEPVQRLDGARLIGRIGARARAAIPRLRETLSDKDEWVRIGAAESLSALKDEPGPSIAALVPLFTSTADVSRSAVGHAANFGQRAEPALREALDAREPVVRRRAAEALGLIEARDEASVVALGSALTDTDADVRLHAVFALGQIGRRAARYAPEIGLFLDQPSPPVRVLTLEALGRLGDRRAVPLVRGLLGDADPFVREHAARTLERLGAAPEGRGAAR